MLNKKGIIGFIIALLALIVIGFVCIVQIGMIYYGGSLFRTSGLTLKEFLIMLSLSFSVIPFDMIRKILLKRKGILLGV